MDNQAKLYQSVIIKHSKHPYNFEKPDTFTGHADVQNPTCGDKMSVYLTKTHDGTTIQSVHFTAAGCALCVASASIVCRALENTTIKDAQKLMGQCRDFIAGKSTQNIPEDFLAFAGIEAFPSRVKCAELVFTGIEKSL